MPLSFSIILRSLRRPTCPLCGVPLDSSGHTYIRSNGHSKESVPRDRLEDDRPQA